MPAYRNAKTGVVVNVAEGKQLGRGWESAEEPEPKKSTTKRTTSKSDSDD